MPKRLPDDIRMKDLLPMFSYYVQLGLRSLRRNPVLTALMVMAIGFGVAASMITYSVFRAVSGNPIPEKSEVFCSEVPA